MTYFTKKLSEIVKFSQGIQVPIGNQLLEKKEGYVRFLRIIDFTQGNQEPRYIENLGERYYVKENDLSMVRYGNPGMICKGLEGILANNLFKIIPIIDINKNYLYLFFKTSSFLNTIKGKEAGAAMKAISFGSLKDINLPLPNLSTQKLIVQKLDLVFKNIDESIKITKRNIENVEELNKSVLDKVFEGYFYETISNLIIKGSNWNPKTIGNEIFEYIDISSIDNKNYILTETKKIKGNDAPSRAKQLVIKNDIIFATTRPNLKNIAIIDIDIKNLTSSTGFCVLRSIEDKLYYKFLYYYIVTDTFFDKLSPLIRGAQYPAVSDKDLKGLKIPLPPLSKQKEIVSYLDEVFEKNKVIKEGYEKKLKDLEEMKQSILKEAFEGRLVKD